jgi:hypothetical protein
MMFKSELHYASVRSSSSFVVMPDLFEIDKEILREHSKRNTLRIARWVGDDIGRFSGLMKIFLGRDRVLVQRSSWIMSLCIENAPSLAVPWIPKMIKKCTGNDVHDSVQRNVMRSLQFVETPKRHRGIVVNAAFDILQSAHGSIAAKAFAMTVIAEIARKEPDLKNELLIVLDEILANPSSAGIRSRAQRVRGEISR